MIKKYVDVMNLYVNVMNIFHSVHFKLMSINVCAKVCTLYGTISDHGYFILTKNKRRRVPRKDFCRFSKRYFMTTPKRLIIPFVKDFEDFMTFLLRKITEPIEFHLGEANMLCLCIDSTQLISPSSLC